MDGCLGIEELLDGIVDPVQEFRTELPAQEGVDLRLCGLGKIAFAVDPSRIWDEPRLLVMIRMVFLKSTVRPWESVTRPSSRICRRDRKSVV